MTPTRIALAAALLLGGAATVAVARPHGGHEGPFGWDRFAEKHDSDGDGAVTRQELAATAAEERFARLDGNGDGRVTEEEFRGALAGRVFGHIAFRADADRDGSLTRAEWDAFVADMDEDGDGTLELRHHRRPAAEGDETRRDFPGDTDGDGAFEIAEAEALFARFDANGDGVVSEQELPIELGPGRHGRFHHGPRGHHGDPAAFLGRLDADGDGSISRAEWDAHVEGRGDARAERHGEMFERLDADSDGTLSREEIESFPPRGRRGRR